MNLDSREIYLQERKKLYRLSTKLLEKVVEQLYDEVYVQYNPERKEYHRMAVFVLNSRQKKSSLIFHLKNLVVR
jgi:ribosomal protein S8